MSETEEKKEEKIEDKATEVDETLIDVNVALIKAENINLKKALDEEIEKNQELAKKLKQATDLIEDETKSKLLAEIKPKVDIPDEMLVLKNLDELRAMKKTLDVTRIPAFKSGTPIPYEKKPSERQKLDSMFSDTMQKLKEGKRL